SDAGDRHGGTRIIPLRVQSRNPVVAASVIESRRSERSRQMRRLHSLMLIAAAVAASTVVTAQSGGQGFHFVEQSNRLPADTNTGSSTTDIDLVDVDGDGDLDIYVTEGTAGFAGRPDRLLINQALNSGIFVDESDARPLPPRPANSPKT